MNSVTTPTALEQSVTFAPLLLIAAPALHDPTFAHTVILLVESGASGSYGVVINRPAPVDLGALLDSAGIARTIADKQSVWLGGPVQPQSGLVLFRTEPGQSEYEPQADVIPGLRVSSSMELLRDVAHGLGPRKFALYLGRASWDAGQLEAEINAGVWLPAEPDLSLLFHLDQEDVWKRALRLLGADPAIVATVPAEA